MVLNLAHRGESSLYSENTINAFQAAMEVGCHGIELDVRLSQDSVPVVIHDATLSRITEGEENGYVHDIPAKELKAFGIPTLEDVMKWAKKRVELFIELKQDTFVSDDLPKAVIDLLQSRKAQGFATLISFSEHFIHLSQKASKEFVRGLTFHPQDRYEADQYLSKIEPLGLDWLVFHVSLITPRLINAVHNEGVKVAVWGIESDETEIDHALALEVDCLITDIPKAVNRKVGDV